MVLGKILKHEPLQKISIMFPVKRKSREDQTLFGSINTARFRRGENKRGLIRVFLSHSAASVPFSEVLDCLAEFEQQCFLPTAGNLRLPGLGVSINSLQIDDWEF